MNHNQLKLKIFLIFSIPAIALVYFSSIFVISEYKQLNKTATFKLSSEMTTTISELIHNIQKERGMSAGYLVVNDKTSYNQKLEEQYILTDKTQKALIDIINTKLSEEVALLQPVLYKVKPLIKQVLLQLQKLQLTRVKILNSEMSFEDEMTYYTQININLMQTIKLFTSLFQDLNSDGNTIVNLQELKEYAGLQRAYVYNLLLSKNFNTQIITKIKKLKTKQDELKERFFIDASLSTTAIYNSNLDSILENTLNTFEEEIFLNKSTHLDANKWFKISTRYIDSINKTTLSILTKYNKDVDKKYSDTLYVLYFTALLWLSSILALIVLIILLKRLMSNEEKFISELDTSKNMYQLLSKINDAMTHVEDTNELYKYFAKILYENSNSKLIWIGLLNASKTKIRQEVCEANITQNNLSLNFKIDKQGFSSLSLAAKSIIEKSILFSNHDEIKNIQEYNHSIFNSINSIASFPIHNENEIVGTIVIYNDTKNAFDGEYISLVEKLINELSFSISKLATQEKREQDLEELRIAAYAFEAQEAMTITDLNGTIIRVNNAFTNITGYSRDEVIGKNPSVLQSAKHPEEFYTEMWKSLLEKGKWHGEIFNKRKNGEIYPEVLSITAIKNAKDITTHYIAQFFDISTIKKAQSDAEHQADHDFLTGLFNRKSLMQRLNEEFIKARRHEFVHAFLFIDLDNFKAVNDYYGHNVGDILIIEVAKRLENIIRQEDVVARISGDEFAIMILNIDKKDSQAAKDVREVCNKILTSISEPFFINEYKLEISSSIGVKLFPDSEKNINDVIVHADTAMYQAKSQGKNQFVFFDHSIEVELKQFTLLESEIKSALKKKEFIFFYQPKIDTFTGKIIGAEMLVRWMHPKKGLLFPDSFIAIANEIGVIHNFTQLALEEAALFLSKNSNIFKGTLAINISSRELLHKNFKDETIEFLKENNINPAQIELEITETDIINDFDIIIEKINELQNFGIKFSIDDFGTGYSSLTYLQKLPVNTLKIDRDFFTNLNLESNKELVRLIANMAKTFNMNIIAEGIENKLQLEFINNIGIDEYQGFYFSRAVDEIRFVELLNTSN